METADWIGSFSDKICKLWSTLMIANMSLLQKIDS